MRSHARVCSRSTRRSVLMDRPSCGDLTASHNGTFRSLPAPTYPYAAPVARYFHVSSSLNRESIREHGLDWARMGAAWGMAGSREPEVEGNFLCREYEVDRFTSMNNTGVT